MHSGRSDTPLRVPGFPIRTSTDRRLVGTSPWLIAASHVLHRLQAPRHPPLALCSLENLKMLVLAMQFSKVETECGIRRRSSASGRASRPASRNGKSTLLATMPSSERWPFPQIGIVEPGHLAEPRRSRKPLPLVAAPAVRRCSGCLVAE